MAINTIGTETFDIWQGNMQVAAEQLELMTRLGRDFVRTRSIGVREKAVQIVTKKFVAFVADAETLVKTTYPAIKGQIVTVIDSLDISYTNVKVLDLDILMFKNVIESSGQYAYIVVVRWTLQAGEQT